MSSACPSCDAAVPPGAHFCPACGTGLYRPCPACGSEQATASAFCSVCGATLKAGARRAATGPEHEERRVVTILFADLAGSTALGARLDPEDLRALQSALYTLVDDEVVRFGGTTEKFAGDAILAVFGIPQAHEDDPERAVRAALAVRGRFTAFATRVKADHGADVGLRIGVDTGEVIAGRQAAARGELMVSGDVANVAARLQQLAAPGEVLVGARARHATRRTIAYGSRRLLDAKGKSQPVPAWDALDAVGEVGAREARGPFVGREDELALLELAASRVVRHRRPQLVTLFGHAGVGKSRLVSEFTRGLDGARVLVGRCVPYGDGITYLPLAEVGRRSRRDQGGRAVGGRAPEARASRCGSGTARAARPGGGGAGLDDGPRAPGPLGGARGTGETRRALHDAWTTLLALLGRRELIVLVIEDVHWASEPLLELLEDVTAGLEDTSVLLLCPSRPELLDARPAWGTGRLHVSSVLAALLGSSDVPADVADRILQPAEGNPFFLEEMLAMLVEQGAIEERDGQWVATERLASTSVPDSIHGVIAARLDLLASREREALRRCSVMGRVFWPSAVGVDDDLVAGLGRRTIVSEQPESAFSGRREFVFKHALTHEVAYATLPRYERGELHRRVAEWLAEVVSDRQAEATELVAFHYDEALRWGDGADGLRGRAYEASLSAGDAAFRRGTHRSAQRLLARAVELAASPSESARALLVAAQLDIHAAEYTSALARLAEVASAAGEAGEARLRADAFGLRARAAWLRGDWKDALESAETAVATLAGSPDSAELARALARLSQIQMLRALPHSEATSARGLGVARRTGEAIAEANVRNNLFTARAARGVPPDTDEVSAIIELACRAGAYDEAVRAVVNYLWAATLLGPLEPTERFVEQHAAQLERGLGLEEYEGYLRLSLGALVYVPAGRWAEADEVLAQGEPRVATNRLVWLWLLTGLALRRGDLAAVDAHLPEFRETALASEEPQRIVPMVAVALPRAVVAGISTTCAASRTGCLRCDTTQFSSAAAALPIARGLAAAGERAMLLRFAEALGSGPGDAKIVTGAANGLIAGLDGQHDVAAIELAAVESALRGLGRHYDAACLALDRATALERAGEPGRAADARTSATALLERLECVNAY